MFIADCLKKHFECKRALFAEHLILVKSMQLHIFMYLIYTEKENLIKFIYLSTLVKYKLIYFSFINWYYSNDK